MSDSATGSSSSSAPTAGAGAVGLARRNDVTPQHTLLRGLASRCPKLHTLTTHMPSVWSPLLLNFATPQLEGECAEDAGISVVPMDRKIVLLAGAGPATPSTSTSTSSRGKMYGGSSNQTSQHQQPLFPALSLYLRGANKHPELMEMIRRGAASLMASSTAATPISFRGRAQTWAGGDRMVFGTEQEAQVGEATELQRK